MKLTKLFISFYKSESGSGKFLIFTTLFTMITVNFILQERFLGFLGNKFADKTALFLGK